MIVSCTRRLLVAGISVLALCLVSVSALAQSDSNPKWDIFAGYQYAHPGATLPTGDPANPTPYKVPDMAKGAGTALTYNFDNHFGLEADFGYNSGSGNSLTTASIGPRFIWRTDDVNVFAHAMLGGNWLNVTGISQGTNGLGAIIGGGIDIPINKSFSWRLFEADYVYGHHNYANLVSAAFPNLRHPTFDGVRLRTGIVYSWGGAEPVQPTAACTIQPSEVFVGEPLTATVTASNFNPKHTVAYSWTGNGGQVTGKDTTATIDTANAAPGSYTVTAHATDARSKKFNEASCSANYTVKAIPPKNPPTMSLSASPASIVTGGSINVAANCTSPDGVPVSVANWQSSGGSLTGSGNSGTLSTAGLAPGTYTITATCTDSRGLNAQAQTTVTVEKPPLPPVDKALEARLSLHSVYFVTAQPTEKDPNGGLLASQERTLATLASDFAVYMKSKPDAHLVLTGHADPRGGVAYNQKLSERRAARVKGFLVDHGVPADAIETEALGDQHNLTAEEVKASVEGNPSLNKEERARTLRNMRTILLASNRRVDISLKGTGDTSVRQFPFNAEDALTLIGGHTPVKKAAPTTKKPAPKKK